MTGPMEQGARKETAGLPQPSAQSRIASLVDMPWRVTNELRRYLALPWIRMGFAINGVAWKSGWRIFGMPIIQRHRRSRIELGERLVMRSWKTSNPLTPFHPVVLATWLPGSSITIGDDCGITGACIVAAERVEIGNSVLLGANVIIADTDFHPLDPMERMKSGKFGVTSPIVIEDNVFIGTNAIILKGVRIGEGSVIGAGSVVATDIPPCVVAAGNPARPLKKLQGRPSAG